MWKCMMCNEVNADKIDKCWKCSNSREPEVSEDAKARMKPAERKLMNKVMCMYCGKEKPLVKRIRVLHADASARIPLIMVVCNQCGHVDMFDVEVFEEAKKSGDKFWLLDIMGDNRL